MVQENNVKRGLWKLGQIEELPVGKGNYVRVARLRVITKGKPVYLNRPIQKLYPLELNSQGNKDQEESKAEHIPEQPQDVTSVTENTTPGNVRRSSRIAARNAKGN